jgi:hypothetical protein
VLHCLSLHTSSSSLSFALITVGVIMGETVGIVVVVARGECIEEGGGVV